MLMHVTPTEATLPTSVTALGGLFEGDIAFSEDTKRMWRWNGASWEAFGSTGATGEDAMLLGFFMSRVG